MMIMDSDIGYWRMIMRDSDGWRWIVMMTMDSIVMMITMDRWRVIMMMTIMMITMDSDNHDDDDDNDDDIGVWWWSFQYYFFTNTVLIMTMPGSVRPSRRRLYRAPPGHSRRHGRATPAQHISPRRSSRKKNGRRCPSRWARGGGRRPPEDG